MSPLHAGESQIALILELEIEKKNLNKIDFSRERRFVFQTKYKTTVTTQDVSDYQVDIKAVKGRQRLIQVIDLRVAVRKHKNKTVIGNK